MAIAYGTPQRGYSAGASAITTSSVATAASGSSFVAFARAIIGSITSVSDNKSNSYSLIGSIFDAGSGIETAAYQCTNGAGGAGHTWTLNKNTANYGRIAAIEVTGAVVASLIDVYASSVATHNGTYNAQPLTTTVANTLLLAWAGNMVQAAQAYTLGGGYTQLYQEADGDTYRDIMAARIVTSSGTYDPQFDSDTFDFDMAHIHVALKEAAAGGSNVNLMVGKFGALLKGKLS